MIASIGAVCVSVCLVLVVVEAPPLPVLCQDVLLLPLPVFAFYDGPRLCLVVVVYLHGVGKGTHQLPVTLDELHVPAPPDHVVQSKSRKGSEMF